MITHHLAADMCRRASARIRALAEAATPGPWKASAVEGFWYVSHPMTGLVYTQEHDDGCGFPENDQADAEHIAAWSPLPALAVADVLEYAAGSIATLAEMDAGLPHLLSLAVRMAEAILDGAS
jgi:hypothetical protein